MTSKDHLATRLFPKRFQSGLQLQTFYYIIEEKITVLFHISLGHQNDRCHQQCDIGNDVVLKCMRIGR